jgi:hypothetical protein
MMCKICTNDVHVISLFPQSPKVYDTLHRVFDALQRKTRKLDSATYIIYSDIYPYHSTKKRSSQEIDEKEENFKTTPPWPPYKFINTPICKSFYKSSKDFPQNVRGVLDHSAGNPARSIEDLDQ